MTETVAVGSGWGERTSTDLSGLLVELSRLMKALGFYEAGHPARGDLIERAYQAWHVELERAGAIEVLRSEDGIRCPALDDRLDPEPMFDLLQALDLHGIVSLRFTPQVCRETFSAFGELLSLDESDPNESFANRFYPLTDPGIEINGEARPAENLVPIPSHMPSASLGGSLLRSGEPSLPLPSLDETPNLALDSADAPAPPADSLPAPSIPADPLSAPAYDVTGEGLRLALKELDRCTADDRYCALVEAIGELAWNLVREGQLDEGFRTALVLTDHAAGQSGCSGAQARMAQTALESMVEAKLLSDIIDRINSTAGDGVRAAQVLLQLGERSVLPLLERLEEESDSTRSSQLAAMILALGEHAVPTLNRAIVQQTGTRAQLAVRLAGELQSPKLVPTLYGVLKDSGPAMRREAAKALVHVGNSEACDVLIKALSTNTEDLPRIAALSLGVLRDGRAVQPLLRALDHAMHSAQHRLAEEIIRALGQFDSHRNEIIKRLARVLEVRSVMRRRRLRGSKLAALVALSRHTSPGARRLLVAATRDPDTPVSERAREILADPDRPPEEREEPF